MVSQLSGPPTRFASHRARSQSSSSGWPGRDDRVLDPVAEKLPAVAAHLDDARGDVLAFTASPKPIWRQIWSNNPLSVNRPWDGALDLAA